MELNIDRESRYEMAHSLDVRGVTNDILFPLRSS